MANTFHCDIVAPEGKEFSGEVEFVSLPAQGGEMGVMANHEPVIAVLGIGKIRVKPEGASEPTLTLAVSGGYAEVDGNVTILADRAIDVAILDPKICLERIAELEKREAELGDEESGLPGRDWVSTQLEWERYKLSLTS